jgi:integrase/recombinase XerD
MTHDLVPQRGMTTVETTDDALIRMWLHGRPLTTTTADRADVSRFPAHVGKPLRAVTLGDVQGFVDSLAGLAPATRARYVNAVKSLFAFGQRIGYLPVNVAAAVRAPSVKETLAERILPEAAVHAMLALEPNPRNRALLRLLYATGMRVSELCDLAWKDVQPRDGGVGQVVAYGKGGKTRVILLPPSVYTDLVHLREALAGDNFGDEGDISVFVFRSRRTGGRLTRMQVFRIVQDAAQRAGITKKVGPHHFRHAHASHALDRGAPVHLVQQTLGHASQTTTSRYSHARPSESSSTYLAL